jgi:hypothetical protein
MMKRMIICLLDGLILLMLHLVYYNTNLNITEEAEMISAINKTERHFLGYKKFRNENYLFINTAYDNELVAASPEDGDPANIVIANRTLLGKLFRKMADHGNAHRFIFCDLIFDLPSPADTLFKPQLERLDHLLLPSHAATRTSEKRKSIFSQASALADYITYEGKVSKIMLYSKRNHEKTLPLVMYEKINGNESTIGKTGLWWHNRYFTPYSIYPRYYFDMESMKRYTLTLSQVVRMLELNDSIFYDQVIRNKIIVIGNFNTDTHVTPIGFMAGSMILFNTYLTLEAGYHLHRWTWMVFLFITFSLLSYYEFYYKTEKREKNKWNGFLRFLGLWGICILISILSSIIFRLHTTILPVILYFELLLFMKKIYKSKFNT